MVSEQIDGLNRPGLAGGSGCPWIARRGNGGGQHLETTRAKSRVNAPKLRMVKQAVHYFQSCKLPHTGRRQWLQSETPTSIGSSDPKARSSTPASRIILIAGKANCVVSTVKAIFGRKAAGRRARLRSNGRRVSHQLDVLVHDPCSGKWVQLFGRRSVSTPIYCGNLIHRHFPFTITEVYSTPKIAFDEVEEYWRPLGYCADD